MRTKEEIITALGHGDNYPFPRNENDTLDAILEVLIDIRDSLIGLEGDVAATALDPMIKTFITTGKPTGLEGYVEATRAGEIVRTFIPKGEVVEYSQETISKIIPGTAKLKATKRK